MKRKKVTINTVLVWILSITAFIQLRPYFVWSTYDNKLLTLLVPLTLIVSGVFISLFILTSNKKINGLTLSTVIFLSIVWIYIKMRGIDSISFSDFSNNFLLIVIMIGFFMLDKKDRSEVFNKFLLIFAISLMSAIIIWIFKSIGINLPWKSLQTSHVGKASLGGYYQKYFGSVFLYYPNSTFLRLSAMYDEPGVVGTFSALFLIADDFRFKRRLRNIIILVGGILSFSMAFYVLIIVGAAIKSFNKGFFKFSIILVVLIIAFQVLFTMETDNIIITEVFQKRFKIIDGSFSGDNRAIQSFDYAFGEFIHGDSVRVLFGYGNNAAANNPLMYGSYTYKMLIYDYGIIGFTIYLGWIIYATQKMDGFNKKCILLMIVFIISIYQRPYVITIPYIFMLFGGYANLKEIENPQFINAEE